MEEARAVAPQRHLLPRRSDNQWPPIGAQAGWEESGAGAAVRDNVQRGTAAKVRRKTAALSPSNLANLR